MTTNNNVTAQTVNSRIDEMGKVFVEMQEQLNITNQLISGLLAYDDDEMTLLVKQIGDLQDALTGIPAQKRELAEALAIKRNELTSLSARTELVEANLYLDVCTEIHPDSGKPMWTNDKQRQARLVQMRGHDKELGKLDGELGKLEFEKAALVAQLNEMEDTCKISRSLYIGCVARLENLTARISYNGREK